MNTDNIEYSFIENDKLVTVYGFDDCMDSIQKRFKRHQETIEHLQEENQNLKSEHYKDETIQQLTAKLKRAERELYIGFPISESENKAIKEWQDRHEKEIHGLETLEQKLSAHGAIGGTYTYEFIPTSVGTIGTIKCNCGAEFTFQDI